MEEDQIEIVTWAVRWSMRSPTKRTHTRTHSCTSNTSCDLSSTSGIAPAPSDLGVTGSEDPEGSRRVRGSQRVRVQHDEFME